MAKPTQKSIELAELILRSEAARSKIGQAHLELKRKLDIPLRIRDSLKSSPLKWVGGSVAAGFVGSLLFRSKRNHARNKTKPEKKGRGWGVGLPAMLFALVKPALKIYASKLLKDYLEVQLSRRAAGRYQDQDDSLY